MEAKQSSENSFAPGILQWLGKVHPGDCIHLMNQMPEASVDLIVTNTPYNIKKQHRQRPQEWQRRQMATGGTHQRVHRHR